MIKIGGIISCGKELLGTVFADALLHFGMALQVVNQAFGNNISLRYGFNSFWQVSIYFILYQRVMGTGQ